MKSVFAALALLALTTLTAQAGTRIDDPVAFVRGVYDHWHDSQRIPEDIYTGRLAALIALDTREAHGEVGRANDFSFWCDCQDGELAHPTVTGWPVENAAPPRYVVEAKFDRGEEKKDILFYFEKTGAGWKLDEVQSQGPKGWTLSVLCKYGWPGGR